MNFNVFGQVIDKLDEEVSMANTKRFERVGVRLVALKEFQKEIRYHNEKQPDNKIITTKQASDLVVKPKTKSLPKGKRAYAHTLKKDYVGTPNVFISHAWGASVEAMLESVITYGQLQGDDGEACYYLDVLVVDQHEIDQSAGNNSVTADELSTVFAPLISSCDEVLLVTTPFSEPLVGQRMWCLFEITVAGLNKVPVTVVAPARDVESLEEDPEKLTNVLMNVKCETATTTVPGDENHLRTYIRNQVEGGFDGVDEMFKASLRRWIVRLSIETKDVENARSLALFMNKIAVMMDGLEDYEASLQLHETSLEVLMRTDGEDQWYVAATYSNIAKAHLKLGDYIKALEMYNKSLAIYIKVHGVDHTDVASVYNSLGSVFEEQGNNNKALEMYNKGLQTFVNLLGADHSSLPLLYNKIGLLYRKQHSYSKALKVYKKSLEIFIKDLGSEHINVATTYNNIGSIYERQEEYTKALDMYYKSLAIKVKVLGPHHISVATAYNNLASVYDNQSDISNALKMHINCVAIRIKALGEDHMDVAQSYHSIGTIFFQGGQQTHAMAYFKKALAILLPLVGPEHPHSIDTLEWIESCEA
eukprot:m.37966 g.37966  ORF g.37966 m.37966 type:complete len:589 (-) comp9378_c0_seq1:34-1800(-)